MNKIEYHYNFSKEFNIYFLEKKNSIGFFFLKDYVNFKFIFNINKLLDYSNFFKIYKL